MQIIADISKMQGVSKNVKISGKTIGCVPTMGFFHKGHISLMEASVAENDLTVVSLFVNPTQFGENEDFDTYPRDLDRDSKLAEEVGVDVLFVPEARAMYPGDFCTFVEVSGLTEVMCGASRPGHFRGVTTVISKLFNIIGPHRAYFGQKDAQQALVIKRMVEDLNFPLEVKIMPTIRETDGLAMSSRNTYLTEEERQAALVIPQSLAEGKALLEKGERKGSRIVEGIAAIIQGQPLARIDYIVVKDAATLKDVEKVRGSVLVAVAVWIGNTRLIDNFIFTVPEN